MKRRGGNVLAAGAMALLCGGSPSWAAEVFALTSSAFPDNGEPAVKNAGSDKQRSPNCVGQNVSPPLAWHNPPEGTKKAMPC